MRSKFVLVLPLIGLLTAHAQGLENPGVLISEFMAVNVSTLKDEDGEFSDWIEIYNSGPSSVDLEGWFLSDDPRNLGKWKFPAVSIPAHEFLIVFASGKDRRAAPLHTNFKLSGDGEFLSLSRPDLEMATLFFPAYPPQFPDIGYGFSMRLTSRTFVSSDSELRYRVPVSAEEEFAWEEIDFVDTEWRSGGLPLGFDPIGHSTRPERIRTDVRGLMEGVNASIFVRIPFEVSVADAQTFKFLTARLKYDDGFVASLNGREIARENTFARITYNARALKERHARDVGVFQEFRVHEFRRLHQGSNLLCLQVLNRHSGDEDLFLSCELEALRIDEVDFQTPVYLDTSPEWPNASGFSEIATSPVTSVRSGVYTEELLVELAAEGDDSVIRYSTSGEDPTEESKLYDGPILITSTTELRSRSFRPGKLGSPVSLSRYVVVAPESRDFSSDLPIFVFASFGKSFTTLEFTPIHLQVFSSGADGRSRFGETSLSPYHLSANAAAKIRGSSSSAWPKRPYAIELRDDLSGDRPFPLLGLPADSDWVLWPPYTTDPAMIRNAFAYGISNRMGHYSPRTRFCEVFVSRGREPLSEVDYAGVYVLMEKVKASPGRVDVAEILPQHDALPEISGGYLFRLDRLDPGDQGFHAGGYRFGWVEPKEQEVTRAQHAWLTGYLDDFAENLQSESFSDPVNGWARSIDANSFINHHIVNVLCKNVDGLRLSTFLYKRRDGPLAFGPLWDFDLSMDSADGRDDNPLTMRGTGDATDYFGVHWWSRLFEDPRFLHLYHTRWREFRQGVLSNQSLTAFVDSLADELRESQERNFERWPMNFPHGSWQGEIHHLKSWLTTRADWLDRQFLPVPEISHTVDPESSRAVVTISVPEHDGAVLYSLDGQNPRDTGGLPALDTLLYAGPFTIAENAIVTARFQIGVSWGAQSVQSVCVEGLSTKNDTLETSDMPGGQIPGDSNQDALLNLSDALHLASIVFLGDSSHLPCRGRVETIPNHTLLDVSGDKALDGTDVIWLLNYLFLNGAPPALGSTCLEIEDCPPVCG